MIQIITKKTNTQFDINIKSTKMSMLLKRNLLYPNVLIVKTKVDNLPNKIKSSEAKAIPTPKKKIGVEILGHSMVNGIQEKGMNKDSNMIIKIRKYPGAVSTDILDHIKPSLRKDPDQILIHGAQTILQTTKII